MQIRADQIRAGENFSESRVINLPIRRGTLVVGLRQLSSNRCEVLFDGEMGLLVSVSFYIVHS